MTDNLMSQAGLDFHNICSLTSEKLLYNNKQQQQQQSLFVALVIVEK